MFAFAALAAFTPASATASVGSPLPAQRTAPHLSCQQCGVRACAVEGIVTPHVSECNVCLIRFELNARRRCDQPVVFSPTVWPSAGGSPIENKVTSMPAAFRASAKG